MTVELGGLIPNLEVLDLKLELLTPMLVLNLLKPLPGLAEVLFSIELFSFFLNDNSIDVCESEIP